MGRVQDKVALVTGAALGIGAASSRLLALEGAIVVLTDAAFEPETGAYGGHHHQGPDAPLHRGIIHQYVSVRS